MSDNTPGEIRGHREWDVLGESDVYNSLREIDGEQHIAVLYESEEERLDVALTFLQLGLEANERCLYVAEQDDHDEIREGFRTLGVDVDSAMATGQLQVLAPGELYLDGEFDPDSIVSDLVDFVTDATSDGYDGLRITGEMPWHDEESVSFRDVAEYERSFDTTAPDFRFSALCQYDVRDLSDEQLLRVVKRHPKFVYRRRLCDNPFYTEPRAGENGSEPTLSARQVLETARTLTGARDAIERREQRVGVLNRVLRHNLRNDVNVVQSHAELIREATDDEEILESTNAVMQATDRLMDIAASAKRVEQSVCEPDMGRVPVDLTRVLNTAAATARDHHPDVAIVNAVDDTLWVESNEELDFALGELFQMLASMADEGAKIVAEIDDECSTNSRRCLVLRCENSNLPRAEIEALTQGHETQLAHGSSLALWLVNWIVELSGGDLSFETRDGEELVVLDLIAA